MLLFWRCIGTSAESRECNHYGGLELGPGLGESCGTITMMDLVQGGNYYEGLGPGGQLL